MGESLSWFFFAILILIGKVFNAGAFTSASTRPLFRKQTWSFKASKNLEVVGDDLNPHDATFVRRLHYVPTSSDKEDLPTVIPEVSNELNADQFATVFTQYAPYIAMHRGSKVVIHLASHLFQHRHVFDAIMDDISILHLLGVQLVLVAGVRDQLDFKLKSEGTIPVISDGGMRVTDDQTMRLLKEVSGSARFEIESALSRGFRGHADNSGINVVSGNFFYSAKPLGVRAGVDFKYTGEVRRIETDNLKKRLDAGDVVLLTSLGHSNSGEVFNVPSESLAAECAAKLQAAKIIFFTAGDCIMNGQTGEVVQSLRLPQATALLDAWGISRRLYNYIDSSSSDEAGDSWDGTGVESVDSNGCAHDSQADEQFARAVDAEGTSALAIATAALPGYKKLIARSVYALSGGVRRAHLIPPARGALLKELYTRDGSGMLISRDVYEGIRLAKPSDVRAVEEIIRPLEEEGILVARSREQLERDMVNCYVLARDGATLACGMLKCYGKDAAEICCLAVHPAYRKGGRGETLLAYLERRALVLGVREVFVLSTRTMQWFEERGFRLSDPSLLPPTRKYDASRGSKVYIKQLGSQRDVDMEELLWNVT